MTGWIILSAVIALLVLLCLLPVGIHIRYDGEVFPKLLIGPFSMTLLPKKKAVGKEAEEEKVEKKTDDGEKKKKAFQKPNREQIVYCLQTLPGIVKKALSRTRKGVTVKPLMVKAVFAGEDPADVAQNYGKAQALVSALYPELKKIVRIKKTSISLSTDYEREQMQLMAEVGVFLRIGTVLAIVFSAGFSLLRWFLGYRKLAGKDSGTLKNEQHGQAAAA